MAILFSTYAIYKKCSWIVFTKAFKVILMLFLYSNPIDSAQLYLSNLIYVQFNNFFIIDLASIN